MSYTTVTKRFTFEAAHHLPNYEGKCRNQHGHSYILEVTIGGYVHPVDGSSGEGMMIDFSEVKKLVRESVVDRLDHQDLNELDWLMTVIKVSTAERLAGWIFRELLGVLFPEKCLERVRLYETADSWVEVTR